MGYLVLNGGEAFTSSNKTIDQAWMKLIFGQYKPRLVVIPAAEIKKTEKQAQDVTDYFKHFNTYADYTMIDSNLSANTREYYEILDKAEIMVLMDGSAFDMVERLQNTHAAISITKALIERPQATIYAAGASAMALGAVYWMGGTWEKGLGIAPNLAIMPRHEVVQMRFEPEHLLANLPAGVTLIGVDELTDLVINPKGEAQVLGQGEVTVYRSAEKQDIYTNGQKFTL
jgi:cyanophycinase-like exopeptidase